jgi:uncharacterized membrane protein YbhN (UPF0104 family)
LSCFVSERSLDVIIVFFLSTYFVVEHVSHGFVFLSSCMLLLPFVFAPLFNFILRMAKRRVWLDLVSMLLPLWRSTLVLRSLVFTLFAWLAQGLILYLLLQEFGANVSLMIAISIYCLSLLVGAASMIPGGLGVTEAGMIWLLTRVGVEADIAIMAALTARMLTLWPAMFIGIASALVLKKSKIRFLS